MSESVMFCKVLRVSITADPYNVAEVTDAPPLAILLEKSKVPLSIFNEVIATLSVTRTTASVAVFPCIATEGYVIPPATSEDMFSVLMNPVGAPSRVMSVTSRLRFTVVPLPSISSVGIIAEDPLYSILRVPAQFPEMVTRSVMLEVSSMVTDPVNARLLKSFNDPRRLKLSIVAPVNK